MKIGNCSKRFIKKHINDIRENDSLRIISINDFGFAPFNFGDDRQKSLILYFDDAIPVDGIYDSLIFNERMARDILNFAINASRDGRQGIARPLHRRNIEKFCCINQFKQFYQ